jgi:hypothetical protein
MLVQIISKIHFNRPVVYHLRLGLRIGLFLSGFPAKISYAFLVSPIRVICPAQLILIDLITLIIFGEDYTSRSPSYDCLYPSVSFW